MTDTLPDIDFGMFCGTVNEYSTGKNNLGTETYELNPDKIDFGAIDSLGTQPFDLHRYLEVTSIYGFPVVGFCGQCQTRVKTIAQRHPRVSAVIDMADCDACLNKLAPNRDASTSVGMRRSWLQNRLGTMKSEKPSLDKVVVVINIETDAEVNDLAWEADAQVFAVDREPPGMCRAMHCFPSSNHAFFECIDGVIADKASSFPLL